MGSLFDNAWLSRFLTPSGVVVISVSAVAGIAALPPLYRDYRGFVSLGPAGLPSNVFGYLLQTFLRPLGISDRLDTKPLSSDRVKAAFGKLADLGFLKEEDVPFRGGKKVDGGQDGEKKDLGKEKIERPNVGRWIVPQRQMSERSDKEMKTLLQSHISSVAATQPDNLHIATSKFERYGPAIFATTPIPGSVLSVAHGEIAHMHAVDGSVHVTLTPRDAALVIERGWAERMGLAGQAFKLPSTLVFVYAPRDDEELDMVRKIVGAGVKLALGSEEVATS